MNLFTLISIATCLVSSTASAQQSKELNDLSLYSVNEVFPAKKITEVNALLWQAWTDASAEKDQEEQTSVLVHAATFAAEGTSHQKQIYKLLAIGLTFKNILNELMVRQARSGKDTENANTLLNNLMKFTYRKVILVSAQSIQEIEEPIVDTTPMWLQWVEMNQERLNAKTAYALKRWVAGFTKNKALDEFPNPVVDLNPDKLNWSDAQYKEAADKIQKIVDQNVK